MAGRFLLSNVLALTIWFAWPAHAANIEVRCGHLPNGEAARCRLVLNGSIAAGDTDKLARIIANPPPDHDFFATLILNSTGGDAAEALRIAELVRRTLLTTSNADYATLRFNPPSYELDSYPCVSACVLILISGGKRMSAPLAAGGRRNIGLHRPYFAADAYRRSDPSTIAAHQVQIMRRIREFLVDEGMATELIEMMMGQSSQQIYWVDGGEWLHGVPASAPWYEEMTIARCNAKPSYFVALNRIIYDENVDEQRRAEAQKRLNTYTSALLNCEMSLTFNAQQDFRRAYHSTERGKRGK